jgi:hypothetical protein
VFSIYTQASDGIVAKGRADVRVKGGRIEMLLDGVGVAVAVHNSAQLILHQVGILYMIYDI